MRLKPAIFFRTIVVTLLISTGIWMRFFGLDWGGPWWFHPDERNIASAVTRISWPDNLDPEFFAYGSFPIYLISGGVELLQALGNNDDPFAIAIIVSRTYSAVLSLIAVFVVWKLGKYFNQATANISAVLSLFTVGFIQFAHYGTFEMWLTANHLLLAWGSISYLKQPRKYKVVLLALLLGSGIGIKVTTLIFLPIIFLILWWPIFQKLVANTNKKLSKLPTSTPVLIRLSKTFSIALGYSFKQWQTIILQQIFASLSFLLIATAIFFITNLLVINYEAFIQSGIHGPTFYLNPDAFSKPKKLLNPDFVHSINVEGEIARGGIEVFYTRQFTNSIPGIFQFIKVYPFILGIPITLLGIGGFIVMIYYGFRQGRVEKIIVPVWFFLQCAFLFTLYVKWSRYLIPTLPYLIISASWLLVGVSTTLQRTFSRTQQLQRQMAYLPLALVVGWQIIYAAMFMNIYLQPDPRNAAAEWAEQNLSREMRVVSEVYDMGIVPMNPHFNHIELFNFYELDHPSLQIERQQELDALIQETDVFVILSRRIWANSLIHSQKYPRAAVFYQDLLSGKLGFTRQAEFSSVPSLGGFTLHDELYAEETFSVFDHPRIQIWVKNK